MLALLLLGGALTLALPYRPAEQTIPLQKAPKSPVSALILTAWANISPGTTPILQLNQAENSLIRLLTWETDSIQAEIMRRKISIPIERRREGQWRLFAAEINTEKTRMRIKLCIGDCILTCISHYIGIIGLGEDKNWELRTGNGIEGAKVQFERSFEAEIALILLERQENCSKPLEIRQITTITEPNESTETDLGQWLFHFPSKSTDFTLTLWLNLSKYPYFRLILESEFSFLEAIFAVRTESEFLMCISQAKCRIVPMDVQGEWQFLSVSIGKNYQICMAGRDCGTLPLQIEVRSAIFTISEGTKYADFRFYAGFRDIFPVFMDFQGRFLGNSLAPRQLQPSHTTKFAYTRLISSDTVQFVTLYNNNQATLYIDFTISFISGLGVYNLAVHRPYPSCSLLSISSTTATTFNRIYSSDIAAGACGGLQGALTIEITGKTGSFQYSLDVVIVCGDSGSGCFCPIGSYPNPAVSTCAVCPLGSYECANYQVLGCVSAYLAASTVPGSFSCLPCPSSQGLSTVTGLCVTCDPTCQACTLPSDPTKCSVCYPNAVLTATPPASCVCIPGYFAFPTMAQCNSCDLSCAQCTGVGVNLCTGCWPGAVLVAGISPGTCQCSPVSSALPYSCLCANTCLVCTGPSPNGCTRCKSNAGLQGTAPSACACLSGFFQFPDASNCLACSNQCLTCTGSLSTQCTKCKSGAMLSAQLSGTCVCSPGFYPYPDPSSCLPCASHCATCLSPSQCLTCCPGASLSSANQCLCLSSYFPSPDASHCSRCYALCSTCSNGSTCDSCISNSVLLSAICVCIDGYFLSSQLETCQKCKFGCSICTSFTCIQCVSGLLLYDDSCVSECPNGYSALDTLSCQSIQAIPPVPSLSLPSSTSLAVDFSKPMNCSLTSTDIIVDIQDPLLGPVGVTWTDPYFPTLERLTVDITIDTTYIQAGTKLYLTFLVPAKVTDVYGVAVEIGTLQADMKPYGSAPYNKSSTSLVDTEVGTATSTGSKAAISVGLASSLLAGNPLSFMQVFNQMQLLSYLSMSKMSLPQDFASTLAALNVQGMFPSVFSPSSGVPSLTPPQYMQDFGLETCAFLSNITTMLMVLMGQVVVCAGLMVAVNVKNRRIATMARRQLGKVKWAAVVQTWLTIYLDVGVFSLIQLRYPRDSFPDIYLGISYIFALLAACLFAATPVFLLIFTYWNINRFTSRSDSLFNAHWGVLYQPFRLSDRLLLFIWYPLFAIRRFALGTSLVLAADFPSFVAFFNTSIAGLVTSTQIFVYIALIRPYESKFDQIEALLIEGFTFLGYFLACLLHIRVDFGQFEAGAVWCIRVAVLVTVALAVARTLVSLRMCMKWLHKKKHVAFKYQMEASRSVTSGENLNRDEVEGIIDTKGPF